MLNKGPVIVPIYASNLIFYFSGILNDSISTTCPVTSIPNHAVLAVGYNIDLQVQENSYIVFKNSWGEDFGE